MKHGLLFIAFLFSSFSLVAQAPIDKTPGVLEVKIGAKFSTVQSLFSEQMTDEETGEPYYAIKDIKTTKYATVFGEKVEEFRVAVEDGVIVYITVVFPAQAKFSTITGNASRLYGSGQCAIGVGDEESGGCHWEGEKCTLTIENVDYPSVYAIFATVYEEE